MITNSSEIQYLYRQYPDFVAACKQITQEALAASQALTEQQRAVVSTIVQSHRDQGTPLPDLDELRRQHDEIWTTCNQRIAQARKDHGVPLLQKWIEALAATGKAIYYEVEPESGRSRTVTLTKTDDGVELSIHLTHVYSNEQYTDDEIENRLALGYYLNAKAWEAIAPPPAPSLRIAARAMADAKYHLASSTDVNALALAEAEYKRIMEDYSRNGENSELSKFIKGKNVANWTRGLEKPGSQVILLWMGTRLAISRREDMKLNTKGSTPEQTLQGVTESEVSALLEKLGYDDSLAVSWP